MLRVYISGPVTGMPEDNHLMFSEAKTLLMQAGYDPVNPLEHWPNAPGATWQECLRADMKLLMDCDGVALLPGHLDSRGSKLEALVAMELGLEVKLLEDWEYVQLSIHY